MQFRSLSILATSTLVALLGCPLENITANTDAAQGAAGATAGNADGAIENSASHDDAVDMADDVSWAKSDELPRGTSALRVLMTDAPLAADSVFVTFCGVHVHARAESNVAPSTASGAGRNDRENAGAGGAGSDGAGSDGAGSAGASSAAGASAAGAAGDTDRAEAPAGAAAGGRDGASPEPNDGEHPEPMPADDAAKPGEAERPAPPSDDGVSDPADDAGWLSVSDTCQTLDLLTLQDGVTEALGIAQLPPGDYGAIRLMLVDASVVTNGLTQELTLPAGSERGVQIGHGFSLHDGEATTITLDFDAGRSVQYTPGHGFMLTPVIEVISVTSHVGDDSDSASDKPEQAEPRPAGSGGAGSGGAGSAGAGSEAPRGDVPPPAEAAPRPDAKPPAGEAPRGEVPPPPDAPPPPAGAGPRPPAGATPPPGATPPEAAPPADETPDPDAPAED